MQERSTGHLRRFRSPHRRSVCRILHLNEPHRQAIAAVTALVAHATGKAAHQMDTEIADLSLPERSRNGRSRNRRRIVLPRRGLSASLSFAVQVCLEEAVANIIMYSTTTDDHLEIVVEVERREQTLVDQCTRYLPIPQMGVISLSPE